MRRSGVCCVPNRVPLADERVRSPSAELTRKVHGMGSLTSSTTDEGVVLSEADAREIERLLQLLRRAGRRAEVGAHANQSKAFHRVQSGEAPQTELVKRAVAVVLARSERARFFSRAMFGEPAWDMLLALYTSNGRTMSVGRLVSMIGEPKTTALRWLDYLEEKRLVGRRSDPADRRVVWVQLLDGGRECLDAYFSCLSDEARALV